MIEQKYSKENQTLAHNLSQANSQISSQKLEIKKLQKTIKNLESFSNPVNEAVCARCNISLEDSMRERDVQEVDQQRLEQIEQALKKKDMEFNNIFRHLEEKNNNEKLYKQELHLKSEQILQLEKDKFAIINENKQLRIDRSNFLEQLKELQDSVVRLKKIQVKDDKLMIDAYVQTKPTSKSIETQ